MKDVSQVKRHLLDSCNKYVDDRLTKLKTQIATIQESLLNETKSTAGDKHETGRAMVQLEREKTGQQLLETEKLQKIISRVNIENSSEFAKLGSLVLTSQANYFIAISAGKIEMENNVYFAISTDTPIGKLLIGKKIDERVIFNNNEIIIKNIF